MRSLAIRQSVNVENLLTRKFENFVRLSSEDKATLDAMAKTRVRRYAPRDDVVREGEAPRDMHVILSGWAYRYKTLEDGRRQILAFFLPGDVCDLNMHLLREMDHSFGALTQLTVAELPQRMIEDITAEHPRLMQALTWETLVNLAIQREWTLNLGQRTAIERISHLLVELHARLRAVGLAEADSCAMPATQTDLADATGLTAVHVNRTLQEMRARNLVKLKSGVLAFPDLDALKRTALFNPNYLHLERDGRRLDANG